MTASLPLEVQQVFDRFRTTAYTTVDRRGQPVCWPATPSYSPGDPCIDVRTAPGDRDDSANARENPKVALLFAEAAGCGMDDPPQVLVQGTADVARVDLVRVRPERVLCGRAATLRASRGCSTRTWRRSAPGTTRSPPGSMQRWRAARPRGTTASTTLRATSRRFCRWWRRTASPLASASRCRWTARPAGCGSRPACWACRCRRDSHASPLTIASRCAAISWRRGAAGSSCPTGRSTLRKKSRRRLGA